MSTYGDLKFATLRQQNTLRGLQFPFSYNNTGGIATNNINERSVKDGLMQLLFTRLGERPMRYDFGTDLRSVVFDPIDGETKSRIRQSIQTAIGKYEPRIVIRNITVEESERNQHQIDISLSFSIRGSLFFTDTIYFSVNQTGITQNG